MSQTIAAFCYSTFFILAVASPFTPVFLVWRLAGLSALAYATAKLIEGPVLWYNQDLGYTLGVALLTVFSGAIVLAILLRFTIAAVRKTLTLDTLTGPNTRAMRIFDSVTSAALGCFAGLLLTKFLAHTLSGATFGRYLDIGVTISAAVMAVGILAISRKILSIAITATLVTLAVTAFIGSKQTTHILETAASLADGRPWCLATSKGPGPISEVSQLGFFALPKSNSYPHLGLLIREGNKTQLSAHWSIRRQEFVRAEATVPSCHPIENFADALESGKIEKGIYGVGPDIYSIGDEFKPRAFTNQVSIRSNRLIGSGSRHPDISERMTLTYNPRKPYVPDNAIPLQKMPNPNELNVEDLTGQNRLIVAGFDETTEQSLVLHCLHGPYDDRLCRTHVFAGSVAYDFYLPFDDIGRWRKAAGDVKKLFEALRTTSTP